MAKKKGDGGIEESASLPDAAIVDWKGLTMMGAEWVRYGPDEEREGVGSDEPLDPASLPPARWYIVQCNPGLEDAVMATLHAKRQNSKRLQQTLVEVLVPTTPVTRLGVGNRPVVRMEKMMPGYVYVHMHMDKDTWYIIKNSNHVQNFVGHDHARKNAGGGIAAGRGHVVPTPLTRAEERRIFDRIAKEGAVNSGSAEVDQSGLRFKVGSIIQVVSGQLMGNQGKVIEFDHDRNRYKVRLDIFKSELPSELSPDELIQVDGLGGPVLDPESVAFEAAAKARLAAAIDTGSKANPWLKEDEQQ